MSGFSKAVEFAKQVHRYQERRDGSPYIEHPLNVLGILLPFKLSDSTYSATILHDVCEESSLCPYELESHFGVDVSMMVYFLSKEEKMLFSHDSEKRLFHYIHKLRQGALIYPQILLIKMADQLDNFKTIHVFTKEKQQEIFLQTKNSYLPLFESFLEKISQEYKRVYKQLLNKLKEVLEVKMKKVGERIDTQ